MPSGMTHGYRARLLPLAGGGPSAVMSTSPIHGWGPVRPERKAAELHRALLQPKKEELIRLRRERLIDDTVLLLVHR